MHHLSFNQPIYLVRYNAPLSHARTYSKNTHTYREKCSLFPPYLSIYFSTVTGAVACGSRSALERPTARVL